MPFVLQCITCMDGLGVIESPNVIVGSAQRFVTAPLPLVYTCTDDVSKLDVVSTNLQRGEIRVSEATRVGNVAVGPLGHAVADFTIIHLVSAEL